jgi:cyclic pyranopterin monophosphate synthase
MTNLSHVNPETLLPNMVNVSAKQNTLRTARALATMNVPTSVINELKNNFGNSKKGPVFSTAILAGTMAVKNTSNIIPLCHSLPIEACQFEINFYQESEIHIFCQVSVNSKTGVEMEALVGASVAALTIYDMCKALSHEITIEKVQLLTKTGGKSDFNCSHSSQETTR